MDTYPDGYVYSLTITNNTQWDLVPAGLTLDWGVWCRGGVDGEAPIAVRAGETAEVLGIRASGANTKGYAFRVAWEAAGSGSPGFPSAVTVFVAVPLLAGGNRAGLDASGQLKVAGWTGVSRLAHGFTHAITVLPA